MNLLIKILMLITLNSPASFSVMNGPVKIYDKQGNPFYCKYEPDNFNLPEGEYTTKNFIQQLPEFTPVPQIKQDVPNIKTGMKHIDGDSETGKYLGFEAGNKASFFPQFNLAVYDKAIYSSWFKPLTIFVMGHEEGHHYFTYPREYMAILDNLFSASQERAKALETYYKVEHQCDIYSRNKMVRNGFNDVQCVQAIKMLLKEGNPRIQMFIDDIKKVA